MFFPSSNEDSLLLKIMQDEILEFRFNTPERDTFINGLPVSLGILIRGDRDVKLDLGGR